MTKTTLDEDLISMSESVTGNYSNDRERARGVVQVHTIQAIRNLQKTIKKLDSQNALLQKTMVFLSIVTVVLTIVQVIVAFSNLS